MAVGQRCVMAFVPGAVTQATVKMAFGQKGSKSNLSDCGSHLSAAMKNSQNWETGLGGMKIGF